MKKLFDQVSESCSRIVTESYSTSFTLATKMLDSSIRQDIYNIYGFVRFADEIVELTQSGSKVIFKELPIDDPKQRRPDITNAKKLLNWKPIVDRNVGLKKTLDYFREKVLEPINI